MRRNTTRLSALVFIVVSLLFSGNALAQSTDFNGDGKADMMWRNGNDGRNIVWLMNGGVRTQAVLTNSVTDLSWQLAGTGDFDGDGKSDLYWRNKDDGRNLMWFMNGGSRSTQALAPTAGNLDWTVAATHDFDGDNKDDILWRTSDGRNILWFMDGAFRKNAELTYSVTNHDWSLATIADFNGDNKTDILWRNIIDGRNILWLMNGASRLKAVLINSVTDFNWELQGSSDFDGDGKADLFWRNKNDGRNLLWFMDGGTRTGQALAPTAGNLDWHVADLADFDGDLKTDILWRTADGRNIFWFMEGANRIDATLSNSVTNAEWELLHDSGSTDNLLYVAADLQLGGTDEYMLGILTTKNSPDGIGIIATKTSTGDINEVTRLSYEDDEGNDGTFIFGDDGLPSALVGFDGSRVEFTNYLNDTVTITFYDSSGNVVGGSEVIPFATETATEIAYLYSSVNGSIQSRMVMSAAMKKDLVKLARIAVSSVGCAASVGAIAGSAGTALPAYALATTSCGSLVASVANYYDDEFDELDLTALEGVDAASCVAGDVSGCVSLALGYAPDLLEYALNKELSNPTMVNLWEVSGVNRYRGSIDKDGNKTSSITTEVTVGASVSASSVRWYDNGRFVRTGKSFSRTIYSGSHTYTVRATNSSGSSAVKKYYARF